MILSHDLAELYGVTTKRLNEQVKRNKERFPDDFLFQLTSSELDCLRSQFATAKLSKTRSRPYAFTEHGALMSANVINSSRAISVSVQIIRAFVKLRDISIVNKEISDKVKQLEERVDQQDEHVVEIMTIIRQLLHSKHPPKRKIGFQGETIED